MRKIWNRLLVWYYSRPTKRPAKTLQRLVEGKPVDFFPTSIAGLHLVGREGHNGIMVCSGEVTDPEIFWAWWRYLGGLPMVDEDGDVLLPWEL